MWKGIDGSKAAILLIILALASKDVIASPYLAFSDMVSGPGEGLEDGKGSGVIVTLWGANLGNAQDDREVLFKDVNGINHNPAHVYYWKPANGQLPSGPANLHKSHNLQEIAFSVPSVPQGKGSIIVEVEGEQSNEIPFTVREGKIFHVKKSGNDNNGNGSHSAPWATIDNALDRAPSGSTIYVHDVTTGDTQTRRAVYWNNTSSSSSLSEQFTLTAYPGTQPKVIGQQGIANFTVEGMVVSKMDVYASNYTSVDQHGQPTGGTISYGGTFGIRTSKNGRVVANRIGDIEGGCASKFQGAINGSARSDNDRVSNVKLFGNEVYNYGCNGSSKLHHTTYLSVRSDNGIIVEPWEWGYNYLHGNKAKLGIHQYDENAGCGDISGPIRIHNNVIVDQGGSGISIGSNCGWTMDAYIENNVMINTGLAADWDGINVDTSDGPANGGISIRDSKENGLTGTMFMRHNLVYTPVSDGQTIGGQGCLNINGDGDSVSLIWENNICVVSESVPFIGSGYQAENKLDNLSGQSNLWFALDPNSGQTIPGWDTNPISEAPGLLFNGVAVSLEESSPLIDASHEDRVPRDVYGRERTGLNDIGPVEKAKIVGDNQNPLPPKGMMIE